MKTIRLYYSTDPFTTFCWMGETKYNDGEELYITALAGVTMSQYLSSSRFDFNIYNPDVSVRI